MSYFEAAGAADETTAAFDVAETGGVVTAMITIGAKG